MIDIVFRKPDGTLVEVAASPGQNVMETAIINDISEILAECGGAMSCATCHVYIEESWIQKFESPSDNESGMLECAIDVNERSRLSCQLVLAEQHNGLIIELPDSQY